MVLARHLEVVLNTVARWERNERGISEAVMRLARLLGAQTKPAKMGR